MTDKTLQALHDENKSLGLYEQGEPNIQSYFEKDNSQPVAWMDADGNISDNNDHKCFPIPLYTNPPQEQRSCDMRTWVGLTDEERGKVYKDWRWSEGRTSNLALCKDIEAKLKEKNT